jgi:hypothetical protein
VAVWLLELVTDMDHQSKIDRLRNVRKKLFRAYLIHVGWLTSTCACAATDAAEMSIVTTLWLVLLTVPPVLIYAVSVHKACRAIDPRSGTFGWIPIILATIFLTPFESALVLPARNLWVARRLLRTYESERGSERDRERARTSDDLL